MYTKLLGARGGGGGVNWLQKLLCIVGFLHGAALLAECMVTPAGAEVCPLGAEWPSPVHQGLQGERRESRDTQRKIRLHREEWKSSPALHKPPHPLV